MAGLLEVEVEVEVRAEARERREEMVSIRGVVSGLEWENSGVWRRRVLERRKR